MGEIIINRSSEFANLFRSIEIYLEDRKIGELKNGESKQLNIAPGKYVLKAKIDWCTSNEINIDVHSDEIIRFNLSGRNPFLAFYYVTFGMKNYLKLQQIS